MALSIEGYDCRVEYLGDGNNVFADLLSRSANPPVDKDFKPLDIDDQMYEIASN